MCFESQAATKRAAEQASDVLGNALEGARDTFHCAAWHVRCYAYYASLEGLRRLNKDQSRRELTALRKREREQDVLLAALADTSKRIKASVDVVSTAGFVCCCELCVALTDCSKSLTRRQLGMERP